MGAQFLETLGMAQQAANGDIAGFAHSIRQRQAATAKAKLGEDTVNQIALEPSADQKSVSVKIPQDHLALLQGVQSQGPEAVREMHNFLQKGSSNEELKKMLPGLVQNYHLKGLLDPNERDLILVESKTNPESAFSKAISLANGARSQTGQAINDAFRRTSGAISDLKSTPAAQQGAVEAKVGQILSQYKPEQRSQIDLKDAATYPGLSRSEAALALDMIERAKAKGLKVEDSFLDKVQNFGNSLAPSIVPPAAPNVSSQDLVSQTQIRPPELDQIQVLKAQQQQLLQQKQNTQFRGPKPSTSGRSSAEVERHDPKTGKVAVFDSKTKKFLRWK